MFGCDVEGAAAEDNDDEDDETKAKQVLAKSLTPEGLVRLLYDAGGGLHDDLAESYGLDFVACHSTLRHPYESLRRISDASRALHEQYVQALVAGGEPA